MRLTQVIRFADARNKYHTPIQQRRIFGLNRHLVKIKYAFSRTLVEKFYGTFLVFRLFSGDV
ncbi:hypothetical protein H6F32_01400 [Anabaena sp. FACHB-1237]|nr:hypothetical protein [Anabaena sp. FACHB-1237]